MCEFLKCGVATFAPNNVDMSETLDLLRVLTTIDLLVRKKAHCLYERTKTRVLDVCNY